MSLTQLGLFIAVTAFLGVIIFAVTGFVVNGPDGVMRGVILGAFAGPIVAGTILSIWVSLRSGVKKESDRHPVTTTMDTEKAAR